MVPSQTFPMAASQRDPVMANMVSLLLWCWEEVSTTWSWFYHLAGWMRSSVNALLWGASAWPSCFQLEQGFPSKRRAHHILGSWHCAWHCGCENKCWPVPAPGHTRAAHGLPESYSSLQIRGTICASNLSFLIESNTSNVWRYHPQMLF